VHGGAVRAGRADELRGAGGLHVRAGRRLRRQGRLPAPRRGRRVSGRKLHGRLAGGSRDCGAYVCGATTCRTSCTSGADCKAGKSCTGGACVDAGLVLRWKFDEASGTTAMDSSGNGFHGTYLGDVGIPSPSSSLPPTKFPNPSSRAFDLARRHAVRLAAIPAKLKPARDITVSFWFRATRVDVVGADAVNVAGNGFAVRLKATEIEWIKHDSTVSGNMFEVCQQDITTHLDGRWHHAAGVSDAQSLRFYLDGAPLCIQASSTTALYDGSDLLVGRNDGNIPSPDLDFDGNLDDVRIYDHALTVAEIASLAAGNE
jgi:Concanavalin A-like lectin/glucanases superfamily